MSFPTVQGCLKISKQCSFSNGGRNRKLIRKFICYSVPMTKHRCCVKSRAECSSSKDNLKSMYSCGTCTLEYLSRVLPNVMYRPLRRENSFVASNLPCLLPVPSISEPHGCTSGYAQGDLKLETGLQMENGDADNVEDGNVATLSEYIDDIEAQELEADLVLGGDEGKECTYRQGYMKRQAVFACLSCKPDGGAGFCTACSLACHDGHEVVELWTRRHFRCDCGNSKFGEGICKLTANKDIENGENSYNQNYTGVYCTCHRVYPDPDPGSEALGEMLQCCICEDWFHERHLGLPPTLQFPRDDEGEPTFDEIICQACVPRCSFLSKYPEVLIQPIAVTATEIADDHVGCVEVKELKSGVKEKIIDVHESERHDNGSCSQNIKYESACESSNGGTVHACKSDIEGQEPVPEFPNEGSAGDGSCKPDYNMSERANGVSGVHRCALEGGASSSALEYGRAIFLSKSWRSQLCRCSSCLHMYTERRITFLLDPEDTLQEYEACAKRKREESRDSMGSDFLKNLGHVQRIELLHGLNDMTAELKSFLTPFGETGRTVTSADIQDFFESLNSKRRRRN